MLSMAPPSSQGSSNDVETRFNHLLNPIRDLTKNWEIDIAAYLEEYLAELEGLSMAFSDGANTLNFAQAALLIQGSTCVYSKKVEYLYSLVFQMLQLLSSKKKAHQSGDEASKDKDITFSSRDSDEFLLLDDVKEQKNLGLIEDVSNCNNRRRSSYKSLPLTPTSIIPLEDREKGDIILLSHKGEILGNKRDYHLNICNLHSSGTLLLPTTMDLITEVLTAQELSVRQNMETHTVSAVLRNPLNDEEEVYNSPCHSPCPESPEENLPTADSVVQDVPIQKRRSLRHSLKTAKILQEQEAVLKKKIDPWKLDSHEEVSSLKNPFRKKTTRRLPKKIKMKLEGTKTKKLKEKLIDGEVILNPAVEFCAKAFFSHVPKFPKNPLKVPEITAFENIYWEGLKKQKELLKNCNKKMLLNGEVIHHENTEEVENLDFDDIRSPDSDEDLCANPLPDLDLLCDKDSNVYRQNTNEQNRATEAISEDIPVVSSYEELVRKHVDNYLKSVAQYCQTTELSKQVNMWEDRIKPVLELENERESFDIHVYGTRMIDCFENNNRKQTLPFSEICKGKEKWKVCRYFVASLQLANNYNVDISSKGVLEEGIDTMELTLLSRKRHHEELTDCIYPSASH